MKLNELNLLEFLPGFMKVDLTAQGFAYAVQRQLNKAILAAANAQIYANINSLRGNILDELAYQFNIPEYSSTLDIETKRLLVKKCFQTHKERGTAGAVTNVISDIFGDGYVEEWFEYGGDKYHFRVVTSNQSVTGDQAALFVDAVNKVKRGSTVMDSVIVDMSAQLEAFYACAVQIGEFYTTEQVV